MLDAGTGGFIVAGVVVAAAVEEGEAVVTDDGAEVGGLASTGTSAVDPVVVGTGDVVVEGCVIDVVGVPADGVVEG